MGAAEAAAAEEGAEAEAAKAAVGASPAAGTAAGGAAEAVEQAVAMLAAAAAEAQASSRPPLVCPPERPCTATRPAPFPATPSITRWPTTPVTTLPTSRPCSPGRGGCSWCRCRPPPWVLASPLEWAPLHPWRWALACRPCSSPASSPTRACLPPRARPGSPGSSSLTRSTGTPPPVPGGGWLPPPWPSRWPSSRSRSREAGMFRAPECVRPGQGCRDSRACTEGSLRSRSSRSRSPPVARQPDPRPPGLSHPSPELERP